MDLLVGATGFLGSRIAARLAATGRDARALVRPTSNSERVSGLKAAGLGLVKGDLKDTASIQAALQGVDTLIVSASSTMGQQEGDSIESVDRDGNLALICEAVAAGVQHIVYVSFPEDDLSFPLQDAKRAVEAAIRESGIAYTILRPTHFFEIWLSPGLGFDVAGASARVFGDGNGKVNWIATDDVAQAVVNALGNEKAVNQTFFLGGPETLTQDLIIKRFEAATGKSFTREVVPDAALQAQFDGSQHSLEKSFAALMLITGRGGWDHDPQRAAEALNLKLTSLDEFIAAQAG